MDMKRGLTLAVAGSLVLLTTTTAGAPEMALQFYQCPSGTGSCGANGIENATVCVDVLDDTLHADVDFGTVVALEELRTRTKPGTPGVRAPGWAKLRVFDLEDDGDGGLQYPFFEGTIRFTMIPPRNVDACRAACDVQYQWNYQDASLPRPIADIHACHIDVIAKDDHRCFGPHKAPFAYTSGGAPDGIYRLNEAGETVMVEDGHQTRVFGMALECPESRLRQKNRPAQLERVRPGSMQEQMRPRLPERRDVDPQRMRERRIAPTR